MSRSGRRTRVYDCNYNMGESYYKPALDRLDRKYSGRPAELTPVRELPQDIMERHASAFQDEDLNTSRRRAERHITEDTVFDSRGGRIARGRPLSSVYDEGAAIDIDEDIAASLRRIRTNKQHNISSSIEDVDLENTVSALKSRSRLEHTDKIMDSVGLGSESFARRALQSDSSSLRRRVKVTDEDEAPLTKWSSITQNDDDLSGGAASRARQSRQRLADLDAEMNDMSDRQAAREKRVQSLRSLMAENDEMNANMQSVMKSTSKVSSMRSEKKVVSF